MVMRAVSMAFFLAWISLSEYTRTASVSLSLSGVEEEENLDKKKERNICQTGKRT